MLPFYSLNKQLASCNNLQNKMDKLKEQIIYTINKDCKDIDELVSILKWALNKAQELLDLKNECELNSLENQTNEC